MLDHLAGPDDVERAVPQRQRPVDRRELEAQLRVAATGPADRRLGDLDADGCAPGLGEDRSQVALPAAEVQDPVARADVGPGKRGAHGEVGGRSSSGSRSHSSS